MTRRVALRTVRRYGFQNRDRWRMRAHRRGGRCTITVQRRRRGHANGPVATLGAARTWQGAATQALQSLVRKE